MTVKIGINGFGRIGLNVLRASRRYPDIQVVAVNHKSRRLPADQSYARKLAHFLKYDSIHGRLDADIQADEKSIFYNGQEVAVFAEADPAKLPWGDLGVDVVVESTGKFKSVADASRHLAGGAKKVVVSAPAKDAMPTFVMGVNHGQYEPRVHHVVSNASCTTNCLAPVAKVLDDNFGIVKGLMTTVHAVTNSQQILDMPFKDLRRGRAAFMSIVPTTTGAAKAVGLVLPHLQGKLNGFAMRVPLPNVSVVDLVVQLNRPATVEEINSVIKDASESEMKGILGYSELPLVSIDFNGDPRSSIVDAPSTMVMDQDMVKVLAWYDNEWGYSNRILDLILYMAAKGF